MIAPSRSAESSMAPSSSSWSSADQVDVRGTQGGHGRLDPGERGAQVVGDGGQQRRAHPVARASTRGRCLLGELGPLRDHRQVGGEGGQHPAVLDRQRPSAQHQPHVRGRVGLDVGVGRVERGPGATGGHHRPAADGVGAQQRRRGHREHLADQPEQLLDPVTGAEQGPVQHAQGVRLPPGLVGLHRAPRGAVHDRGDRDRHQQEQGQRDEVVGVLDAERVQRRGEEPVQQQAPEHRRDHRRPQPADQGAGHGQREVDQRLRGGHARASRRARSAAPARARRAPSPPYGGHRRAPEAAPGRRPRGRRGG